MTVYANKPAFNVREKLKELDKPSGIAGEAMLRAETPQEQFNLIGAGRRNKIINGSMLIWQRGTVQPTSTNNSYHCVDRWAPYSSGRTQYQQSTDVPDGFAYAITTSGTPTGEYIISHGIELPGAGRAGEFYVGQKFTVSYYAKSTVAGDRLMDWMAFRVGQTSSSSQVEAKVNDGNQYHSLSTGWKRYSRTYTITGTPGSTNICLTLAIRNHWDNPIAAGNISITGVQVEIGSTVTPFEHRSYGEELALCQRYCYVIGHPSQVIYLGTGSMYTTTAVNLSVPLPVQLRHNSPSFTRVANSGGNWLNVYVGATGTVSNAAPLQGDYTQSNMRLYIPNSHSGNSPSAAGAGVWSMVLAGAQLIINAEV
jgi:hypothetical protein